MKKNKLLLIFLIVITISIFILIFNNNNSDEKLADKIVEYQMILGEAVNEIKIGNVTLKNFTLLNNKIFTELVYEKDDLPFALKFTVYVDDDKKEETVIDISDESKKYSFYYLDINENNNYNKVRIELIDNEKYININQAH